MTQQVQHRYDIGIAPPNEMSMLPSFNASIDIEPWWLNEHSHSFPHGLIIYLLEQSLYLSGTQSHHPPKFKSHTKLGKIRLPCSCSVFNSKKKRNQSSRPQNAIIFLTMTILHSSCSLSTQGPGQNTYPIMLTSVLIF